MITGLAEVIAGLLSEAELAQRRADEARDVVGNRIAETAAEIAPKLTGATAASISYEDGEVGPTTPYAPFVEFGTVDTAPQPFMGPAASRHEDELPAEVLKRVGEF
jgi:HK97 gp10 family phage protein